MKRTGFWLHLIMGLLVVGCETGPLPEEGGQNGDEIIKQLETQEHIRGGLNPFPLIDNPLFVPVAEIDYLQENDRVFICKTGADIRVYSQRDMLVEVVNTEVNGIPMAITYCPITRSGIAWNRVLGVDTLLLTASGYLYKENLMPLDVISGNIWSQMLMQRFQGNASQGNIFAFREISTFPLIEIPWSMARDHFPEARVFKNNKGIKSATAIPGEQQLGIIGLGHVQTFSLDMFPGEIGLHNSALNHLGTTVVAGSSIYNYMLAFRTKYMMEAVEGQFPVIMRDESGTLWNIFGEAVSGEREGEVLESPLYYTAADWAWRDLFEQVQSFEP